jgi:DNA helicase HerA-like ATPase
VTRFRPALLKGSQRITFLGQTGSGKSVLARNLLKQARRKGWRIVIIDPKKDWMKYLGKEYPYAEKGRGTVDSPVLVSDFNPKLSVQIFQPLEWTEQCERFFKAIIACKNTIVYIDEITQLASATIIPRELKLIWTQGRSLKIGAWCATQRPKGIPVIVKDQSEVWFMFRVNSLDDRKVVKGYMPLDDTPEVVERPLPKYWFYYWEDSMTQPVLVKPLKLGGVVV